MKDLIEEFNLEKRLFSVVVDNAGSNDKMMRLLKDWYLSDLVLGGYLFHTRCATHILNLIVQDGVQVIKPMIEKLRETSRYLKRSPYASQKFKDAKRYAQLDGTRGLTMDVPNRWNSTFLLLESALPLREAFRRFAMMDSSFTCNPSEEEWSSASIIVECLRPFYLNTLHLSGTKYTTSNLLFAEICEIRLKLVEWERSEHAFIRAMATSMLEKYLKYWDSYTLSCEIANVLDPRCKMLIVKWYYGRIYGENSDKQKEVVENVIFRLRDLFVTYGGDLNPIPSDSSTTEISPFDLYCRGVHQSELDKYLDEGKETYSSKTDFDILDWWNSNKRRFPDKDWWNSYHIVLKSCLLYVKRHMLLQEKSEGKLL